MNRENIIRMAREAGIKSPDLYKLTVSHMSVETLERFAALVAAAAKAKENEVCAKVCEALRKKEIAHWNAYGMDGSGYSASDCATAIRARRDEVTYGETTSRGQA